MIPRALPQISQRAAIVGGALAIVLFAGPIGAGPVEILQVADRATALAGDLDGVSVGPLGELRAAPEVERVLGLDEPFVFSAAQAGQDRLLGTGNEGKIFLMSPDGTAEVIAALPEPEIFAVHTLKDGTRIAAGSPEAKVYRLEGGEAELLFDAEASYVWALAEHPDGGVLAATGLPGRVLRFHKGKVETLYEGLDAHVRALWVDGSGDIYLGTAGQGLVVRIGANGETRTLYDADEPEVLSFARLGDTVYAVLLASEAGFVDLGNGDGEEGDEDGSAPTVGSRAAGHEGPRSVVLAFAADGTYRRVAELEDETVHAAAVWAPRGATPELWLGTGQDGRLYRLQGDELIREAELEDRQLVALLPEKEGGLTVVTTNGAGLYRLSGERRQDGTFESKIHDLGQPSDLGVFRWRGDLPKKAALQVRFRTGLASRPDATWTPWSEPLTVAAEEEVSLAGISGRYLQWQLQLNGAGHGTPTVRETELSYRGRNRAPEIDELTAREPGVILVPQSFNPTSTTFEPWTPNRDGIFTSVRKEKEQNQLKTLWKKGYRTLEWEGADADDDTLRYRLEVRRDDGKSEWLEMTEDLEDAWYSFDSTVLPDGVYRFRVTANDGESNGPERGLNGSEISDPVVIDHSAPQLVETRRQGRKLSLEVRDERSPLMDAVWSVDAGPWQPVRVSDGLLDSRQETLQLEIPEGARMVLLRLTDGAFNVVTLDLSR